MAKPPLTVPIAGFRHYPAGRRLLDMPPGTSLRLVREPTNQHDPLAVQVRTQPWQGDQQLGYVPKTNNVDVAWALDDGVELLAVFAGNNLDKEPAMQIVWP
jgi:hypothetical protein